MSNIEDDNDDLQQDLDALSMLQDEYVKMRLETINLDNFDEMQQQIIEDELRHQHIQIVRQAIENGLKVPDRVIVEYNSLSEEDKMSDEELEDLYKKHQKFLDSVDEQIWQDIDREVREERRKQYIKDRRGGIDGLLRELDSYKVFNTNPFRRNHTYTRSRKSEKLDMRKTLTTIVDILLVAIFVLIFVLGIGYFLYLTQ